MARLSCLLLVVFCVGAVTVRADENMKDPWFPWWSDSPPPAVPSPPPLYPTPDAPSPYYDAPPYMDAPPTYPPPESYPPTYPPPESYPPYDAPEPPYVYSPPSYPPPESYPPTDGPEPSPWLSSSLWVVKTDSWPAKYQPDTEVGDVFGDDAEKVYGQVSMLDGLMSKGEDGYSALLKQGITALLNAGDSHFKYSEKEIKKGFSFETALSSEAAATVQAKEFEAANEAYSHST